MTDFDRAFPIVIGVEKSDITSTPGDAGGVTKFGISQRAYPGLDIANLTIDQAKAIYQRDFWAALHCDLLPWPVNAMLFEAAVNDGMAPAVRALQASVGLPVDGLLGPATVSAVGRADQRELVPRFLAKIGVRYAALNKPLFLEGWLYREFKGEQDALTS